MEHPTSNNNINAIKEVRRLFNELKVIFLVTKQRELEENFASMFFKEKEQDGSLTNILRILY